MELIPVGLNPALFETDQFNEILSPPKLVVENCLELILKHLESIGVSVGIMHDLRIAQMEFEICVDVLTKKSKYANELCIRLFYMVLPQKVINHCEKVAMQGCAVTTFNTLSVYSHTTVMNDVDKGRVHIFLNFLNEDHHFRDTMKAHTTLEHLIGLFHAVSKKINIEHITKKVSLCQGEMQKESNQDVYINTIDNDIQNRSFPLKFEEDCRKERFVIQYLMGKARSITSQTTIVDSNGTIIESNRLSFFGPCMFSCACSNT